MSDLNAGTPPGSPAPQEPAPEMTAGQAACEAWQAHRLGPAYKTSPWPMLGDHQRASWHASASAVAAHLAADFEAARIREGQEPAAMTAGQAAYEAWSEGQGGVAFGTVLAPWPHLHGHGKLAWRAAARAAIATARPPGWVAAITVERDRLAAELHRMRAHPDYEYETVKGPRKQWNPMDYPPAGDGWQLNSAAGRLGWDRFDYHEEAYWRRLKPAPEAPGDSDRQAPEDSDDQS